jgi:hypothetical protein
MKSSNHLPLKSKLVLSEISGEESLKSKARFAKEMEKMFIIRVHLLR